MLRLPALIHKPVVTAALAAAVFALTVSAQTSGLPISVRVTLPNSTINLTPEGNVEMDAAGIGQPVSANFVVTNNTNTSLSVNFIVLTGANDFALSGLPSLPLSITAGATITFNATFTPSTSLKTLGRVAINYGSGSTAGNFGINFTGLAPEFVFSYIPQGGNAQPLLNGGTIQFPLTNLNATSSAVVVVYNKGSYQGVFNSANVSGAVFTSSNVPLPGATVNALTDVRFVITYTPTALDPAQGSVTIQTADTKVSFNLQGAGQGALYSYQLTNGSTTSGLLPNQTITIPDTPVSSTTPTSVTVTFKNTGNLDGTVSVIGINGAGFTLSNVPILPLAVPIGQQFSFIVNFLPTTAGPVLGSLRIGQDVFTVSSSGLGSTLTYAYVINGVSTTLTTGTSVNFTPVPVGGTTTLRFTIANTGNQNTTVSSIGLTAASTIFTVSGLPALPINLAPNATTGFNISFAPTAQGVTTATLRLDNYSVALTGTGSAPPALSDIKFTGTSGTIDALQQVPVGLSIAQPYPLDLTGTLTLAFNPDVFANDPAVQFSTGGRSVNFTIPANTTNAVFPNNQTTIRIQTGSVQGTITLTPSISTLAGGILLSPTTPPTQSITIPATAPRILGVSLGGKTANTVTVVVSGYATNRSITQIQLTFTPTTGENVGTTQVTLPVESSFIAWYTSSTSAQYGSLFSATIPLTLAGDIANVTQVSDTVRSVSVTVTNRLGTTSPVSLALR